MRLLKRLLGLSATETDESSPAEELYFALLRTGLQTELLWRDDPEYGRVRILSHQSAEYVFTPNGRHLLTTRARP